MRDFIRGDIGAHSATDLLRGYSVRLTLLHRDMTKLDQRVGKEHPHSRVSKQVLMEVHEAIQDILGYPEDEHEARMNEYLIRAKATLPADTPWGHDIRQSEEVAGNVLKYRVLMDFQAISDSLATKRMEQSL